MIVIGRLRALQEEQAALLLVVDDLAAAGAGLGGSGAGDVVDGDLAALRGALAARTVSVGVSGLVNRGNSTIVNALVGSEVSATRVVPETAVPVEVRHAPEPTGRLHLTDGTVREVTPEEAWAARPARPTRRSGVT